MKTLIATGWRDAGQKSLFGTLNIVRRRHDLQFAKKRPGTASFVVKCAA